MVIIACIGLQSTIVFIGGTRISLVILGAGIFGYLFSQPIIVSCNQAIWQSKVPLRLQGRVFALQQTLERSLAIGAYVSAGPLVDNIFNPLMNTDGVFVRTISKFVSTEMAQGVPLLLILLGGMNLIIVAIAYRDSRLRNLERELPDRDKFLQKKVSST